MQLCLNRRTGLACEALSVLDDSGKEYISSRELAGRLEVSTEYVTKVLAPLVKEGWITSTPGPTGGYRLAIDLRQLCVLDLIEAVEGRVDRSQCMHGDSRNPAIEPCAMHDAWVRAREALLTELELTPLAGGRQTSPTKGA